MNHPLRFGLKLSGQETTIDELRAVWRIADEADFDHVWDFDHMASIGGVGPDRPVYEGWALQAAMAEATQRVRIGCMVTGNIYRNPIVLAKMAITVDHLSAGRLEFGIGAGWAEIEQQMYGFEGLEHRIGRLSESVQIIKSLFTQDRTNFDGRYYHFRDAIANPKPVQKPFPPFWMGGTGEQVMRLIARHADVWNTNADEPIKNLITKLDDACVAVGRDPSEIRRSLQIDWNGKDRNELLELSGSFLELGVTEQIIYLRGGPPPVWLAERVAEALPELRRLQRVAS